MDDQPLHPVIEIPTPALVEGSGAAAHCYFDAANSKMLVASQAPSHSWRVWWLKHAADATGSASLLLGIALLWTLIRCIRRPQERGRSYCRSCNHDVTPQNQDGSVGASLCPECGTSLAKKRPTSGSSAWRRIALRAVILAPLLLTALFVCYSKVERKNVNNIAWPLATLEHISWWPLAVPAIPVQRCLALETYSLTDFRKISESVIDSNLFASDFTADLRCLAFARQLPENGFRNQAVIFDIATGRERVVEFGGLNNGFLEFHGYTPDAKAALYSFTSAADSIGTARSSLFTLSLNELTRHDIASIPVLCVAIAPSVWQPPWTVAAVGGEPAQWAFIPMDGPGAFKLSIGTMAQSSPVPKALQLRLGTRMTRSAKLEFQNASTLRLGDVENDSQQMRDISIVDGSIAIVPYPKLLSLRNILGEFKLFRGESVERILNIKPILRPLFTRPAISPDKRWLAYSTVHDGKCVVVVVDLSIPDK